ncbi:MAG: type II toxin-antitoxin system RelB/DinJ family antitoxin [Candidatus Saccharimonadales bacterium]
MNTTTLSIRTDEKTKAAIKAFADSLGLSVSALVTTTMRQTIKNGSVTLTPLEPTPYLEEIMREAEEDLKAGREVTTIHNEEELNSLFEDLGHNDLKTQQKM